MERSSDTKRKEQEAKERQWFPKVDSVALNMLAYICEAKGYTLEDIVWHTGMNAASAVGSLYQLRRAGYVKRKVSGDRVPDTKRPKWGRNVLRPTPRGVSRLQQHEDLQRKQAQEERHG